MPEAPVIDLEAAHLPSPLAVREGFVLFHTQEGTLHRATAGAWEDISHLIPTGKVWLTPALVACERRGDIWVSLDG
jgi:hypothetical protein